MSSARLQDMINILKQFFSNTTNEKSEHEVNKTILWAILPKNKNKVLKNRFNKRKTRCIPTKLY